MGRYHINARYKNHEYKAGYLNINNNLPLKLNSLSGDYRVHSFYLEFLHSKQRATTLWMWLSLN